MSILEITIQRETRDGWLVVTELIEAGRLPRRCEGTLRLEGDWRSRLLELELDPRAYGTVIGEALFRDRVRDALMQARVASPESLRMLLIIEDEALTPLHWEWLCAPIRLGGRYDLLALDQQVLFSRYLPSLTDRRFPAIGRRDLRALVLVASPPEGNEYNLAPFNVPETVTSIGAALGEIPYDVLEPPTLSELMIRITGQQYTLLHVVAHGALRSADGETILYLLDAEGEVEPVTATRFLERLDQVQGLRGLPHLAFLAICESAAPGAETADALGGLAQRLVRELGMPAVVAMTQIVSISTAQALAACFYGRLREHGEPDRALVESCAGLADEKDVTVPALFSRLGGRPLFSDAEDRELTRAEIEFGLAELDRLLPERAPVLRDTFAVQAEQLRGMVGTDREQLSEAAKEEWDEALLHVNAMCEEVLNLNFRALALEQELPAYDPRCPFPGLLSFGARFVESGEEEQDDRQFFFGREKLVGQLQQRLAEQSFLAVLGPSGSGKSSLVLAGLIPALQEAEPGLQMAYLTPGRDPADRLDAALAQVEGQPAILVVDQFEELFTQCTDEEKRCAFLDLLLPGVDERRIVVTMRADFWGDCAPYRDLAEVMQACQVLIAPMSTAELRSAMEQQAGAVGLRFEADLAHTILEDVRGEPGAMPLLQHALLELWERRHGRWLKAGEYRAIGGARGAIAQTAGGVLGKLSTGEQDRVRDIFVRLTRVDEDAAPGEDWRDTRRRVGLEELVPAGGDAAAIRTLVNQLADARLVVTRWDAITERTEVEVAHEALIRSWEVLRGWLDEDREVLRQREGVRRAAVDWEQNERDPAYLVHHGRRLDKAEALLRHPRVALNAGERAYVEACLALRVKGAILELRDAMVRREPAGHWLDRLRDGGQALIQQLEEPSVPGPGRQADPSALDQIRAPLGLSDVTLPEWTGEGEPSFGPVAWSAVSHQDPGTRQTAALALTVPYDSRALERLIKALDAWGGQAHPGRWQQRWRRAEVWGSLGNACPALEESIKQSANLSLADRASVWLWRRLMRDRERILALTLGGAVGAGVGLALLRGLTALATGLTAPLQSILGFWWGLLLGAGLTFGLLLPQAGSRERGADGEGAAAPRVRPSAEWRAVIVGTLGFGLVHLFIGAVTGYLRLEAMVLVNLAGLLMGLGISLGFYGWSWSEGETRSWRWLLRLLPVVVGALLGQMVVYLAGREWPTAVGFSGSLYRSELSRFGGAWWHGLVTETYRAFGLLDAVLVAVALFVGIAAGGRLAHRWLRRLR